MSNRKTWRFCKSGIAALVLVAATLTACSGGGDNRSTVPAPAGANQDALDPKGPAATTILNLFTPFFWIAVVIGVLVLAGLLVAVFRFRARPGEEERPKQTHGNAPLEVGWTILPALILLPMAVFTVSTIFELAERPDDALQVNVVGKQWFWEYEYADAGFFTANELHIPVGRPVTLRMTSDNVIHSFWVPNLAGKKDLVPGRFSSVTIEADEAGTFLGQCAEYCGLSHANMRLRVIAQPAAEFDDWAASQTADLSAERAEFVNDPDGPIQKYGCTGCHAWRGVENAAARIGPDLTHFASRSTFAGAIFENSDENLRPWVRNAPAQKPNEWKKGVGMPSFAAQMTDEELDQIVEFLRTSQ